MPSVSMEPSHPLAKSRHEIAAAVKESSNSAVKHVAKLESGFAHIRTKWGKQSMSPAHLSGKLRDLIDAGVGRGLIKSVGQGFAP